MDELEKKYTEQHALYEEAVRIAMANPEKADVEKIKTLNIALSKTLHDMIESLTHVKKEHGGIVVYRDELIARLRRIQKEYNGMLINTDKLETLRRIREQEEIKASGSFTTYFFMFIVSAISLVILILWKGSAIPEVAEILPSPSELLPSLPSQLEE